ncbi:MAG: glycosyltransferase [Acidobacteria bacterium]|nr:glycosyltransferase [Acidobacteriota bacterium]
MQIVILGLSITSSWGNGHATTYRALVRELARDGHEVLFLERDVPWYASHRDLPSPPYCRTELYGSLEELRRFESDVRQADIAVIGSYVPQGTAAAAWMLATARGVTAFYDIDTPVTVAALARGACEYLEPALVPRFDLYLSFTGGPMLRRLERQWGARRARALYCSVDPRAYAPTGDEPDAELGYLGTYSADRQPALERLLIEPARRWPVGRFTVAGPQYPEAVSWPANVARIEHVAPPDHPAFYGRHRFALNITRADMVAAGHSPSVRLFEAAACGVPVISDAWPGLEEFFVPGREIAVAGNAGQVLEWLRATPERERQALARRARDKVLSAHTARQRAAEFLAYAAEATSVPAARSAPAEVRP